MSTEACVIAVDVGTGSARAGVFDATGRRRASHVEPIKAWRPAERHVEQSSVDIWRAVSRCVRDALAESGVEASDVVGIGFDATCSMVVAGPQGRPLAVNADDDVTRDVIVWMDHRATPQAELINTGDHEVLRYVGGRLSPEMQTPKLLWLKTHLRATYDAAWQFFDLPDWLTWRACGSLSRSLCTTVCKWTYLGHERDGRGRWDEAFFDAIGLRDALGRIGDEVRPIGTPLAPLTERAAGELGLTTRCVVGQGLIDAHAGGIGLLGSADDPSRALALIGGTSSCHMAVSREPRYIQGVWGPYFGAMVPGLWLSEGGQSAAGAAIDHAIADHAAAESLLEETKRSGRSVYDILNEEVSRLGGVPTITKDVHVLADFNGNRSPLADPHVRGVYDGVSLETTRSDHARRYYATLQAVAYGTRDILETLNRGGYDIDTVLVTGGGTKNPLWLQEHADATGMTLVLPEEPEAVLMGSAIVAATAAGVYPDLSSAMRSMTRAAGRVDPRPQWRAYHDAKFGIYQSLQRQQASRRTIMSRFG